MTNINIEKISNGFVLTIGSEKIFCDVPEAVCGRMAEWILEECKRAEDGGGNATEAVKVALRQIMSQQEHSFPPGGLLKPTY